MRCTTDYRKRYGRWRTGRRRWDRTATSSTRSLLLPGAWRICMATTCLILFSNFRNPRPNFQSNRGSGDIQKNARLIFIPFDFTKHSSLRVSSHLYNGWQSLAAQHSCRRSAIAIYDPSFKLIIAAAQYHGRRWLPVTMSCHLPISLEFRTYLRIKLLNWKINVHIHIYTW